MPYGPSSRIGRGRDNVLPLVALVVASMRGETGAPPELFPAAITTVRHFTVVNALVGFEIVNAGETLGALRERAGEGLVGFSDTR